MKTRAYHFMSCLLVPLLVIGFVQPIPAVSARASALSPTQLAHVKIAHFAPFANTVDATAVGVTAGGNPVGVFKFDDMTPIYYDVPAGVPLQIVAAPVEGGISPVVKDVQFLADTYYTVSLIGNGTLQPLELITQIDGAAPYLNARVRFTNFAPIAANIDDTQVDVCDSTNTVVTGLGGIAYKESSQYYILPVGDYKLKIAKAGTNCNEVLFDLPIIHLPEGQILDIYFIGDGIHLPLMVDSSTSLLYVFAHVKFNHFASFAPVEDTSVTVQVDGLPLLIGFKFGDMTPGYTDISAGVNHQVEIFPSAGGAALITQTINLSADTFYTLSVIGDVTNQPLELFQLVDDNTRPSSGARVRLAHFAPMAGLPAINICENGVPLVEDFVYKDFTAYLSLPAGTHNLVLATTIVPGLPCLFTLPITIPPIVSIDFTVVSAFAIGDGVNVNPPTVALRWDQPPPLFLPIIIK